jgi:phosphatidylinositol-3-phosphatase
VSEDHGHHEPPAEKHPMGRCLECESALASDQRYCLCCGARRGPRPPTLERILEGLGANAPQPAAAPSARSVLPGPRTAAVLTLAMLGFGTVAGAAASNPAGQLSALRRAPLTLLMPAHAPVSAPHLPAAPPAPEASPTPVAPVIPPPAEPASAEAESTSATGGKHAQSGARSGESAGGKPSPLPPVKHVFVIMLADQPYAQTFGPESPAPYLSRTLERRGELLVRYYAVAREELANEIALVSGLGPTPQTAANCPTFTDIVPAIANKEGQYSGAGCVYPSAAKTIGDQLDSKKLTWRVYAEAMNDGIPTGQPMTCRHPRFGFADPTSQLPLGEKFATFRDPFSYFDSVIDAPACAHRDVGLEDLTKDLKRPGRTPAFSYIVPDLCHDGRPTPCAPGAQSGLPAADAFLHRVVPQILASQAYRHGGLLVVTTDQAPATGEYADSSSCCLQPRFPAPALAQQPGAADPTATSPSASPTTTAIQPSTQPTTTPTTTQQTVTQSTTTPLATGQPTTTQPTTTQPTATQPTTTQPTATQPTTAPGVKPPSGGGQVGALLLSPYVKPGTTNQEPFNAFSLLKTIENLFGLPHLGYARLGGLSSLEASVFSAYTGG